VSPFGPSGSGFDSGANGSANAEGRAQATGQLVEGFVVSSKCEADSAGAAQQRPVDRGNVLGQCAAWMSVQIEHVAALGDQPGRHFVGRARANPWNIS
jgi:hypothetical protein